MSRIISKFTLALSFVAAAALFNLMRPAEAEAQTVFCPPPLALINGSCTDGNDGAFSGAALSSQALSGLSQTTTQQTTTNTVKSITTRREQEQQRCPEGFTRVDGSCQRISRPAPRVAAPVVTTPRPRVTEREPTARKETIAARRRHPQAPSYEVEREMRRERIAERRRRPFAPPAARIVKGEPEPPPLPVPLEPAFRYGTWAQIYGDYEKRDASGPGVLTCCLAQANIALPGGPPALTLNVQSRTGTVGFLAGADLTTRGLLSESDGLILGLTMGYASSNLDFNASSISSQTAINVGGNTTSRLNAHLSGPTPGLYATYFNGGFSTDLAVKFDAFTLDETFNDLLGTTGNGIPSLIPIFGAASVGLLNTTVAGNLNYRFLLGPNFWIEPTVGAQYTHSSYGSNAFQLGLADGDLVMVQGGARLGATTLVGNWIPMTATLTGLAYDDVSVSGGFIPTAGFAGNNLLIAADEGKVRGRGILAFNFDLGQGFISFIQGEVRGGSGLIGTGGKAGIRYQW